MFVIDASVVVKALTEEAGSEAAAMLIADACETIVPDFIALEVASALAKKVRLAGLPPAQAQTASDAPRSILPDQADTFHLIDRAMALSAELNHALFDCLYLALALGEGATLVTSDRKFLNAIVRSVYSRSVIDVDEALNRLSA